MVPGKGARSTLRPVLGRCHVPGGGAALEAGGQEGAHGCAGWGRPGKGEGA